MVNGTVYFLHLQRLYLLHRCRVMFNVNDLRNDYCYLRAVIIIIVYTAQTCYNVFFITLSDICLLHLKAMRSTDLAM